jgi:RNA polymerase sigma-70 factor, ECF subfamily
VSDLSAAITRAQEGDEESFATLYRALQPGLLRYLRALVGDDAEDVAADTWLQIARDLLTFRGDEDGFRGWSATIARHRAMDHLRRMRRRPAIAATLDDVIDVPDDADSAETALDALSTDVALQMIARLPRDQAEAVLLRVVLGLDAQRAAQVLGKRVGAVRTAAYRGLRRLRETLDLAEEHRPDRRESGAQSNGRRVISARVMQVRPPALKDTR